MYPVRKFLT